MSLVNKQLIRKSLKKITFTGEFLEKNYILITRNKPGLISMPTFLLRPDTAQF